MVRYLDSWDTITGNWFLIADYLLQLDRLHHNEAFGEKERAAIVASRVYYFLNEYNEALKYALRATGHFTLQPIICDESIGPQDELYVNKIIGETFVNAFLVSISSFQRPLLTSIAICSMALAKCSSTH